MRNADEPRIPQIRRTLLRERSNVVDQVPQFVRGYADALQRHVTFPGLQRAEQFAVRLVLHAGGIREIGHLVAGIDVALAIAGLPMTHCAIVSVIFLTLRERLGTGFYGIDHLSYVS